jgi:hypothetical protein
MEQPKTLVNKEVIEDFLIHETFVSLDESFIMLQISLNNKKFIVSRDFENNTFGLNKLDDFKHSLDSINKFKLYLGV